jgi:hypothetical protein
MGYFVDVFIFTYESPIVDILVDEYKPSYTKILPSSERYVGGSWNRQIIFHKYITEALKMYATKGTNYDFIINTRFDLEFNTQICDFDIDLSKFNVECKYNNGNCDDNIWIFNSSFVEKFEESINLIFLKSQMTLEINKYIDNIHFMHKGDDYTHFKFLRIK